MRHIHFQLFALGGVLFSFFVNGCLPSEVDVHSDIFSAEKEHLELFVYSATGMPQRLELSPDSSFVGEVRNWFSSHRDRWKVSFDTYAPRYLIKGTRFALNIRTDYFVLNYEVNTDDWRQVVRPSDPWLEEKVHSLLKSQAGIQN